MRARATRSTGRRTAPEIREPHPYVASFIAHRNERSDAILARLAAGDDTIAAIVRAVYVGLDPRLVAAAGRSVLAHLVALVEDGPRRQRRPAAARCALSAALSP